MSDHTLLEICQSSETYNVSGKISSCLSEHNGDQMEQDSDIFGHKEIDKYEFSYPTESITKLSQPAEVDEVLQSAMIIEICDKISMDKPKITHQSLVSFSQFNQNSDFVYDNINSTFYNYNSGYSTAVVDLMKTGDIYNSLKQYLEIIRNDFTREIVQHESRSILKVLSRIQKIHPRSTVIFQRYLRFLPQFEKRNLLKQFFGFFSSNPNLLYNGFLKLKYFHYKTTVANRSVKRKSKAVLNSNVKKFCASNATQTKIMIQNLLEGITESDFYTQSVSQHPCQEAVSDSNVCNDFKKFNTPNEISNSVSCEYRMINDIEFDLEFNSKLQHSSISVDKQDIDILSGGDNKFAIFTTGHGKVIPVKKETIERGKKIFETLPILESHKNVRKTQDVDNTRANLLNDKLDNIDTVHFINGHEKVIPVCKESIKHGQKIFQDVTDELNSKLEHSSISVNKRDKDFLSGCDSKLAIFTTGHGKVIPVKNETIEYGKKIFETLPILESHKNVRKTQVVDEKCENLFNDQLDNTGAIHFIDGHRKMVPVCKESIKHGQKIFQDVTDELNSKLEHSSINVDKRDKDFLSGGDSKLAIFTTGHGKVIPVKKETIERGKRIFETLPILESHKNVRKTQDVDNTRANLLNDKLDNIDTVHFINGHEKVIPVCKESIKHGQKIFQDVTDELNSKLEHSSISVNKRDKDFLSGGDSKLAIFTTGHGKVIPVKNETIEFGKKIFETLPKLESRKNVRKTQVVDNTRANLLNDKLDNIDTINFIDGHEKVIPLHMESIKGGQKTSQETAIKLPESDFTVGFENTDELFIEGNEKLLQSTEENTECPLKFNISSTSGFSTATRKNIFLKKESMEKAKHLFMDICDDNELPTFSTGQGNTISVRKENLERGRKMLHDLSEIGSLTDAETENKKSLKNEENMESDGKGEIFLNGPDVRATFTTANGKPITVPDEFLERGEKIFQESSEFDSLGNFIGFSTSFSNKPTTNINENLLENEKNHGKSVILETDVLNQTRNNGMHGFSTAAGRNISVKNEFISKAKNLFDDINETNSFAALTIGNRNIDVKKGSVERSKKIFGELLEIDSSNNYNAAYVATDEAILSDSDDSLKFVNDCSKNGSERKNYNTITTVSTEEKGNGDVNSSSMIGVHISDYANKVETRVGLESVDLITSNFSETSTTNIDSLVKDEVSNMDIEQFFNTNFSFLCDDTTNNDQSINECVNRNFTPNKNKQCSEITSTSNDECEKREIERTAHSPIIEARKIYQKSKLRKRKSQLSNCPRTPLKITYHGNREVGCNLLDEESTRGDTLEELKRNFAQKSNKRKTSSVESAVPVKKCIKFDNIEIKDSPATKLKKFVDTKPAAVCKPITGWYTALRKRSGQVISLLDAVGNSRPGSFTDRKLINFGVKSSIIRVNSENAANFKFSSEFLPPIYSFELIYGDSCRIIPNENGEVDINSITLAFLAAPGVDPKLISEKWIMNHYRWIIWKLASVEKSFPEKFGGRYLNIDNVMFQLKYRYDKEVDNCERSALKRIVEFDDTPSKSMILCVASIAIVSQKSNYEYDVELTDGWYSLFCLVDQEICKLIYTKKIVIGSKLLITNSELVGLNEGCDPIQVGKDVRLKISANSTRRVRWHARLGFYFQTIGPIVRNLKSILPNGGISFPITVLISRIYPMMYIEKRDNGYSEICNEKVELRRAAKEEQEKQVWYEGIVSQITREVQAENNIDADSTEHFSEEALMEMQQKCDRIHSIIRERVEQKVSNNFREKRKVLRLLKIRIANDSDESPPVSAMVTIWNPSDDIFTVIREGRMCTFSHLNAISPNSSRNNELRLSSTRWTKFELHNTVPKCNPYFRKCVGFWELKDNFSPSFGEVDIVGVVIGCTENDFSDDIRNHSIIYLADLQMNLTTLKFRSTVKDSGMEDIIKRKQIVAAMNLHWSNSSLSRKIPVLMVDEYSVFMLKSKHRHLQDGLEKLSNFFQNESVDSFILKCQNKIKSITDSSFPCATSTPLRTSFRSRSSIISNDSFSTNNTSVSRMKVNVNELENSRSCNNSSGIFNKSSNISKNQSRIDKLCMYDDPPPLSPIQISTKLRRSSSLK